MHVGYSDSSKWISQALRALAIASQREARRAFLSIGLIATSLMAGCDAPELPGSAPTPQGQASVAAEPSANSAPNSPSIDGYPQDLWKKEQLTDEVSMYSPDQVDEDLKQGGMALGKLKSIPLKLSLPPRDQRVWGKDGRTFFVLQGSQLLRIAVPSWRVTHRVDLSETSGYEMTMSGFVKARFTRIGDGTQPTLRALTLSSEGLVVAIRHVENAGGDTGRGSELIYSDRRTGKIIEERIVIRQLIVFDPATLAVKRQFHGPASAIAGSPASPIVAVAEPGRGVGLLDIRTGKVVDADWLKSATAGASSLFDVPDMIMAPDGKSLYVDRNGRECVRIDVSQSKLQDEAAATFRAPLDHTPRLPMALSLGGEPAAFDLSPDGRRLAVYHRDSLGGSYSLVPTDAGADSAGETTFKVYDRSIGCTFAGPRNRFIYTMNLVAEPIFRLELAGNDGNEEHSEFVKMTLEESMAAAQGQLCGWPAGDHLLLSIQPGTTLLVQLPATRNAIGE